MQDSQQRLEDEMTAQKAVSTSSSGVNFEGAYRQCRKRFEHIYDKIVDAL